MSDVPPDPPLSETRAAASPRRRRRRRSRRAAGTSRVLRAVDRALSGVARRSLAALMLLALGAGAAGLGWVVWAGVTGADPYRLGGPGVHFEGEPLPQGHRLLRPRPTPALSSVGASAPLAAGPGLMRTAGAALPPLPAEPPLSYRQHCVWGKPGSNPYRGTVVQALQSARLPDEVVREVAAKVAARNRTDRLEIRRDGIRALGSGRVFDPRRVALTFGQTLCLGSRVNFAAGHMEPADLYEAADSQGRVYAVMVPEVCGNVSVLSQQGERRSPRLLAAADTVPGPMRRLPAALEDGGSDGVFAFADARQRNDVPEPGTLGSVLVGLVALAVFRRRR